MTLPARCVAATEGWLKRMHVLVVLALLLDETVGPGAAGGRQTSQPPQREQVRQPASASGVTVAGAGNRLPVSASAAFQFNATMGLGNPWIGFVPYAPAAPPGAGIFPHSMENFYVPMSSLMAGWQNFTWAAFEKRLDSIAARGNQAIICPCFDCPGLPQGPHGMAGTPAFLREGLNFYNDSGGALIPDWLNTTVSLSHTHSHTHTRARTRARTRTRAHTRVLIVRRCRER